MYVTDIEVIELPEPQERSAQMGSVVFTSYERQIQVMCSLQGDENNSPAKKRLSFVRDALRQLSRMPEFRGGRAKLEFAPQLLPEGIG
ncbi:hypothetical protein SAMN05444000_11614 [Shimia gijangensis]|uniref:Uncharacterized protein n=1 Tax=Shimia gijangensis TaxID=1470563 RepID=A0A1M6NJE2_9RHOB|nr:hypothetical protein [Shimia gijangensis]SHJ95766.1 hypothetical protein SAMN05444000_11614 [Shimia gijangensis]